MIACSYLDQEFIRVGYYVYNEYHPFEGYNEEIHGPPPTDTCTIDNQHILRRILADKPRITRFPIHWSGNTMMMDDPSKDTSTPHHLDHPMNTETMNMDSIQDKSSHVMTSPFRSSSIDTFMIQSYAVTPDMS